MNPSPSAMAQPGRIHGLDAMRASMMLLGLVIHAACSYMTTPANANWPFRDPYTSASMLYVSLFIHAFRMPAFYTIAGFFAALFLERQGDAAFVRNRAIRILVPFLVGWAILYPLTYLGFGLGQTGELRLAPELYRIGWDTPGVLVHLWFLYFLLFMYVGTLLARRMGLLWPALARGVRRLMVGALLSRGRLILISLPTALLLMPSGFLHSPLTLSPDLKILAVYGYSYFVGWMLYGARQEFGRIFAPWPTYLACGVMASVLHQYAFLQLRAGNAGLGMFCLATIGGTLACWGMVLGSIGFFLRFFARESATVRYLGDASYWIYLIHLPIVAFTAALLKPLAWPALAKFSAVMLVAAVGSLVTYELFVRYTFFGAVLHGQRQRPVSAEPLPGLSTVKGS